MASTSFGVLITGDSKGAVKAIDLTSDQIKELEATTEKATKKIKTTTEAASGGFSNLAASAAKVGAAIGVAAVAIGGLALRKVIQETSESDYAIAQLNATLTATGGAAGKSSEELIRSADAMQKVTTFSDESVLGVESLLLAFKNVKGDTFDRATAAVLDMATALKTDAPSAAKILGKALDDPEKAITRLARSGVTFTAAQKETITAMVEMGDVAGAQSIILGELEGRYKGSAAAARDTLGGALKGLENSFGELFEVSQTTSEGMVSNINSLSETLARDDIKDSIDRIAGALVNAADKSLQFFAAMNWAYGTGGNRNLIDIADEISGVEEALAKLEKGGNFRGRSDQITALKKQLSDLTAEYDKQVKAINGTAKAAESQSKAVAKSTTATTGNTAATKDNSNVHLISEATKKKSAAASDALTAAHKKTNEQLLKAQKSIADTSRELTGMNKKTEEYISSLKYETEQLGLSERQQFINNKVREAGTAVTEKQIEKIREAAAALYDEGVAATEAANVVEAAARQQEQMWSHLTDSISDIFTALVTGADKSKGIFGTISDGFSAMIKKMLAEAASNEVVIAFGGTAANGQNSQNSDMTGRLTNAATTYGISELLSGAAKAFTGSKEDIKDDPVAKTINKFADASWKPIEWLTGKSFSDVFGQKNDGNNRGGSNFDLSTGKVEGLSWGNSSDPANTDAATSFAEMIKSFSDAIGGSSLAKNITIGGKGGIQYDGQTYGADSNKFLKDAFNDVIDSATNLNAKLKPLIVGFDGTASEIATFASTLVALDESSGGLTDRMLELITSFEGAAEDASRYAAAIVSVDLQTGIDSVANAVSDFSTITDTAFTAYGRTTDALQDAIYKFDGSADAAETLNTALAANKTAAYQFASAIQAIGKKISEIAAQQANDIRESVLSAAELQKKRTAERDALRKSLDTLIDPADIEKTSEQILSLNKQIFDGLADEAKASSVDAFAGYAEETAAATAGLLDKKLKELGTAEADINTAISNLLRDSAAKQLDAANIQLTAANIIADAARTLSKAPAPTRPTTTAAPVTDVYSEVA